MGARKETKSPLRRIAPLLVLALLAGALWLIHHKLRQVDWPSVRAALGSMPGGRIAAAFGLTAASYSLLTLYDALALSYLGRPLSYGRTALAAFVGYVFNFNIGVSVVGGTAVRYRVYSHWGLTAWEIGKVVAFCAFTGALGLVTMGGLVFALGEAPPGAEAWLPVRWLRPVGGLMLGLVVAYLAACFLFREPMQWRSWKLPLPRPRLALGQVAVAGCELAVAGTVIFALYPPGDVPYLAFLGVYLVSLVAGLISHVPGGLGVFETVFLVCLPTRADHSQVLATLLAFRVIYYLIPLGMGGVLLAAHELLRQRGSPASG